MFAYENVNDSNDFLHRGHIFRKFVFSYIFAHVMLEFSSDSESISAQNRILQRIIDVSLYLCKKSCEFLGKSTTCLIAFLHLIRIVCIALSLLCLAHISSTIWYISSNGIMV